MLMCWLLGILLQMFFGLWSQNAEAGLFRACCRAGGRSAAGRLLDVRFAQHFVSSSLAPVLLFRRRLSGWGSVSVGSRMQGGRLC